MRLFRPDVRRVHLGARLVDLRRQVGAVMAERERLLDVGRRRLAHRIGDGTVAEPVVAAADLGRRPLHLHLLFDRQGEEIDRALARLGDEVRRNAVPGHHEEAGVHAGRVDRRATSRCSAALSPRSGDRSMVGIGSSRHWSTFLSRASAVDLKFLSVLPRVRHRNFKSKTALEL